MARLNEPPAAPASSASSTTVGVAATSSGESVDACTWNSSTCAFQPDEMRTKSKIIKQDPPADIEEVKRRFIRQNRELAKNNSTQSLRIRSLELDVSRLLEQNLDLRNQVLHLQNELYKAQVHASSQAARKVRDGMKAKLAELSAIVDAIEDEEEVELPQSLRPGRPIEGQWRERQLLTEIMRESQMPTISEDRDISRRTLGADELRSIHLSDQSSTESPDLGPPPVARLDCEDPVKNASPLGNKLSPPKIVSAATEEDDLPAALSANLETRRKRKETGQSRLEMRRKTILLQSPEKAEGGPQPASTILRTGAKRKLADREGEKPIKPPSKGDFTFSRKAGGENAGVNATQASKPEDTPQDSTATEVKTTRRVLGDKSVNMSPRKTTSKADKPVPNDLEKAIAPLKAAAKDTTRRRRTSSIPLPSPPRDNILETVEIAPPTAEAGVESIDPRTPAPLDLFSPTPSAPSTRPDDRRGDTPPPSDLSSLSIATTDGGDARPSRRARAAVNYAEPSLISKMRRPDKKMVDAISGLQDPRRAMNASSTPAASTVLIKPEPVDGEDEAWKNLLHIPAADVGTGEGAEMFSPLEGKSLPPMRRVSGEWRFPSGTQDGADADGVVNVAPSNTAPEPAPTTISSLLAANGDKKRRHSSTVRTGPKAAEDAQSTSADSDLEAASKKLRELDLYEFKESSSPLTDNSANSTERTKASLPRAKTAQRRYSAMPGQERVSDEGKVSGAGGEVSSTLRKEAGSRVSRRRSMML